MAEFLVRWEIEVTADSQEEAVILAREIQLDPESTADEFEVVVEDKGHFHSLSSIKQCYECEKYVSHLFEDSRCGGCTRLTPEEVRGEYS